ncbi:MAG: type I restriction endonuclease subunit R [Clostridiaceae bacterium]|nr:type I restriction endonuclease subunit R [Clostridiaceae bacterium]
MAEKDLWENPFRDEIYDYFLDHGYVPGEKSDYDYKHALDVGKLFQFLEATQAEELARFKNTYGSRYRERYVELLCQKIECRGLLTSLNEWVEDYASGTKFCLAYFKSGMSVMHKGIELYEKNIFSIRKEFSFEDKPDPYRVDLALFLNGIPLVMIELKKQTAGQKAAFEGTKQFKTTRNPDELIFSFNRRTLVYFTLDEFTAFLTTRLDRKETRFLPFNRGSEDESAGNPVVHGKHSTCYLWEYILRRDMLLRIIREFMFIDDEGTMIFPRYHQLRAVLRCEHDVQENGVGERYLIWHSAGSGKTKTIAWLAKRLINQPDINTVIVISDRTVIDGQLGAELMNVDGKKGVAQHIDTTSRDLLKKLNDGGYIIVTTLQKFRPILNEIKRNEERNYAIIIDEAHSSTAGKSLSKASETLTGKSLKESVELDDIYEDLEDGQNQLIRNGAAIRSTRNVSYFAFTATPKKETMELFGTRTEIGKTYFDKYSMKQAIEERFILNPLLCYTSYRDFYRIEKKKEDDTEYDSAKAQVAILNYVTTSDEVIRTKTEIMMSDFVDRRLNWLEGRAKAMIITPSRKHAVCYKLAVDEYLKKHGCGFRSCVAFTGTIELDGVKFTEEQMNRDYLERGVPYDLKSIIRNNDDCRIIIVADKLQSGFDENALCIMYIEKKLNSSVKAVQTISRVNRPAKNKRTFVMDFVNDPEIIKGFFSEYYGGELYLPTENETDPNILFTKRDLILDYCVVTLPDAQKIYKLISSDEENSGELTSMLAAISRNYRSLEENRRKLFALELKKFGKLFYYISTVYNVWNPEMEQLAIVFDVLFNVLYEREVTPDIDASELVELVEYSTKLSQEEFSLALYVEDQAFDGIATDVAPADRVMSLIDEIIEKFNLRYAHADEEIGSIITDLSNDKDLQSNVQNSSISAYEAAVKERLLSRIMDGLFEGTIKGDTEKAEFYTELNKNSSALIQIRNAIIHKINDLLLAS